MKQYGGWVLTGVLSAVILYLIFRPVPSYDNKEALAKIDSLTKTNTALRGAYTQIIKNEGYALETLGKENDSLKGKNDLYKYQIGSVTATSVSLAKQVQYYKAHLDTASYDSACDLLAEKAISDSIKIQHYVVNTDHLINTFTAEVNIRDSVINQQAELIYSDSILIKQQSNIITIQQKQIKKATTAGKITAWIARALAVAVISETIILITK